MATMDTATKRRKLMGCSKEIIEDDILEYIHTFETLGGFQEREVVRIPGPICGSKTPHIQWNITFTYLGYTARSVPRPRAQLRGGNRGRNRSRSRSRSCSFSEDSDDNDEYYAAYDYKFRLSAIAHNANGRDQSRVNVTASLTDCSPKSKNVRFEESEQLETMMDFCIRKADPLNEAMKVPSRLTASFKFQMMQRSWVSTEIQSDAPMTSVPLQVLQKSLKNLLDNGEMSDVNLVTPNGTIRAHKALLTARSSVFRAMFSSDMVETNKNQVEIIDFDKEIVHAMLEYIYTGATEEIAKNPGEMLHIADKYNLEELREVCIVMLPDGLRIDNAVEKLVLADRFNVKGFKKTAIQFFRANQKEIVKTQYFRDFVKSNPELFLEAMYGNLESA